MTLPSRPGRLDDEWSGVDRCRGSRVDAGVRVAMGKAGASRGCSWLGAIRRRAARLDEFERGLPCEQPSERLERTLGRGALMALAGRPAGGLAR
jgi:hypothetical protein